MSFDADSDSAVAAPAPETTPITATTAAGAVTGAIPPAPPPAAVPADTAARRGTYTLSFAALLSLEDRAKTLAASITVDGHLGARRSRHDRAHSIFRRRAWTVRDEGDEAERAGKADRPPVLGIPRRAVTSAFDSRQTWWEDEGRRIADQLRDVSALLVAGTNPEHAARVALGIARARRKRTPSRRAG